MSQPIKLQLNAEALEALFPAGSEARVELQNAVIAQFLRQHIKPAALGAGIQEEIEQAQKLVVVQVLRQLGHTPDMFGSYRLSDSAKTQISAAVQAEVRATVSRDIRDAVEAAKATVQHDATAAVNRIVNAQIAEAVKARLQEVAKGVLGG